MDASKPDPDELAAANINPQTGLATDYLNHFNEVAMLIDMLSAMPDVAEEILDWRPISYPEHFSVTGFRAKELAIIAFETADVDVRARFEAACGRVERAIGEVQEVIKDDPAALIDPSEKGAEIYELIANVGGVINAGGVTNAGLAASHAGDDQAAIDALFG